MLEIGKMRLSELEMVLDWAASEGWNPGLEDASAFLAADPQGFLLGRLDQQAVCAISVVRYTREHGFLGLYLCQPQFRGQGHGWSVWNAGMAFLGERCIGLDGVVQQQDNYRKSGFVLSHRNIRYVGQVSDSTAAADCVQIDPSLQARFIALDQRAGGVLRQSYMQHWSNTSDSRITLAYLENDEMLAAGTIRQCLDGHKIGPLLASDQRCAEKVLRQLLSHAAATRICIDVPECNPAAIALVESLGLQPVFETARMYRGKPPVADMRLLYGVTTLELG